MDARTRSAQSGTAVALAFRGMPAPVRDLSARSLRFATDLTAFVEREQRRRVIAPRLLDQLLRAGTAIGAHNAEAESAITRRHLLALRAGALKEATESTYWLKLVASGGRSHSPDAVIALLAQVSELTAILTVCVKKLRGQ